MGAPIHFFFFFFFHMFEEISKKTRRFFIFNKKDFKIYHLGSMEWAAN